MNIKKREREKDGSERRKMRAMGERASEIERGEERGSRDMTAEESERKQRFLFFFCLLLSSRGD